MSNLSNFNLFGNVLHRKQISQWPILDPQIIFDGAICDNMLGSQNVLSKQLQSRRSRNGRSACLLLSSVAMITLEAWRNTKTQRTQVFHILVLSFFSWCKEYNLLPSLLKNVCFLIDHLHTGVPLNWEGRLVIYLQKQLFLSRCSIKKVFLEISQNSQVCNFIKKVTLAQMFSCEFCRISKNTFFYWTTPKAAPLFKSISLFWKYLNKL